MYTVTSVIRKNLFIPMKRAMLLTCTLNISDAEDVKLSYPRNEEVTFIEERFNIQPSTKFLSTSYIR